MRSGLHTIPISLWGHMRCGYPKPLKAVRFVENSLLFYQLIVLRAEIPCVLDGMEDEQSTQPVTMYITVNVTPSNPYNSSPSIQTGHDKSPTERATVPEHIQLSSSEHPLPLSHQQPVETSNTTPQMSPTSTENPRSALHQADESMKPIHQIDRSKTWEKAVRRIKWVMDTLGPIAEVRVSV